MNEIKREHYPAHRLPDDLRGSIDPSRHVTVVVVEEDAPESVMSLEEILRPGVTRLRSSEEIDRDLAAVREEWADRD
jgi:hypothetical protein